MYGILFFSWLLGLEGAFEPANRLAVFLLGSTRKTVKSFL